MNHSPVQSFIVYLKSHLSNIITVCLQQFLDLSESFVPFPQNPRRVKPNLEYQVLALCSCTSILWETANWSRTDVMHAQPLQACPWRTQYWRRRWARVSWRSLLPLVRQSETSAIQKGVWWHNLKPFSCGMFICFYWRYSRSGNLYDLCRGRSLGC